MKLKNVLLTGFSFLFILVVTSAAFASSQVVTLGKITGQVEIISGNANVVKKAETGAQLGAGDSVKTYINSTVEVNFKGVGVVLVKEKSLFKIEMAEESGEVKENVNFLSKGEIEARVRQISQSNSKFLLKTPVAVATVRGTTYIVKVKLNGESTVYVVEGIVELKSLLSNLGVTIHEGESSTANSEGEVSQPSTDVDFQYIDLDLDNGVFEASPKASPVESRDVEANAVNDKKNKKEYYY